VELDGAGAQEQPCTDVGVRQAVAGESRDLFLLRCQLGTSIDPSVADRLAGGQERATRTLGERLGPDPAEAPA
jgi:hypothetical protein